MDTHTIEAASVFGVVSGPHGLLIAGCNYAEGSFLELFLEFLDHDPLDQPLEIELRKVDARFADGIDLAIDYTSMRLVVAGRDDRYELVNGEKYKVGTTVLIFNMVNWELISCIRPTWGENIPGGIKEHRDCDAESWVGFATSWAVYLETLPSGEELTLCVAPLAFDLGPIARKTVPVTTESNHAIVRGITIAVSSFGHCNMFTLPDLQEAGSVPGSTGVISISDDGEYVAVLVHGVASATLEIYVRASNGIFQVSRRMQLPGTDTWPPSDGSFFPSLGRWSVKEMLPVLLNQTSGGGFLQLVHAEDQTKDIRDLMQWATGAAASTVWSTNSLLVLFADIFNGMQPDPPAVRQPVLVRDVWCNREPQNLQSLPFDCAASEAKHTIWWNDFRDRSNLFIHSCSQVDICANLVVLRLPGKLVFWKLWLDGVVRQTLLRGIRQRSSAIARFSESLMRMVIAFAGYNLDAIR